MQERVEKLLEEGYEVRISDYISAGYQLFSKNPGYFIGFTLIYFLISLVISLIPFVGSIVSIFINGPLLAGFYYVAHKLAEEEDGDAVTFEDFFKGFDRHLAPLILVSFISGILTGIGMVFLLIPGIYLAVAYMFAIPFVVFYGAEFWDAMEASRKVITENWMSFFGLAVLLFFINVGGALLCGVGLLVTMPISYCTIYLAFRDIVGVSEAEKEDTFF